MSRKGACATAFLFASLFAWGCSRGPDEADAGDAEAGKTGEPAAVVTKAKRAVMALVELPGNPVSPPNHRGFQNIGDVNGDGRDDIVMAIAGNYPGLVIAFSGADGKELYRVKGLTGKKAKESASGSFTVSNCDVASDYNGDGVKELYVPHGFSSRGGFLIFSGVDGAFLHRQKKAMSHGSAPELRDHDGDGKLDFVFRSSTRLTVYSPAAEEPLESRKTPGVVYRRAVANDYPDTDGDGKAEVACLWADVHGVHLEICTSSYKVIKETALSSKFMPGRLRGSLVADADGDGKPELVFTARNGAGIENRESFAQCFSLAAGKTLWRIAGSEFPAARRKKYIAVPVRKGGVRKEYEVLDARIGAVERTGDLDGDGVGDALLLGEEARFEREKTTGALYAVSLKTGKVIGVVAPPKGVRAMGPRMRALRSKDAAGDFVAVGVMTDKNKPALLLLDLRKALGK